MKKVLKASHKPRIISDLKDLLEGGSRAYGDKDLYIYKENKQELHYTYRNMYDDTNRLGTAFASLGIGKEKIAVIGDAHPMYMTAYYAAVNGGGVIIPLDKEISESEIVNFLNRSHAAAIIYTASFNGKLLKYTNELPEVKYFIPITYDNEEQNEKLYPIQKLLEFGQHELDSGKRDFLDYVPELDKMCVLIFTSGTTGTSKGVMLSQRNLTAAINACGQSMEYDDEDSFVSVLPMNHTYEVTCCHLTVYNLGATGFLNDSLKYVMRNFAAFKPTGLILVPLFVETMHKKIWDEIAKKGLTKKVRTAMKISNALLKLGIDKRDAFFSQITNAFGGNLLSIVCGGAPISPDIVRDFFTFGIFVIEGYGITECSPLVAVNKPGTVKYRSVGQPVYGCSVKIDKTPEEETGEILVKGDNVMLGYYENEEATREAFTEDGWFRTGDIGYMDRNNYIYITGRKKNVIILSNGKNIFPEEIEEHLSHCSLIAESVVIGRANANGETVITAIIYPGEDILASKGHDELYNDIKEAVNDINRGLPVYKQIRNIELRDTEFDKTTTKKIKRYLVK